MPNASLTRVQKVQVSIQLFKTDGTTGQTSPDLTSTVQAFTGASNIVTAHQVPGNNRLFEIVAHAAGSANITFAGPSGATEFVTCTVTQPPDSWQLQLTLGTPEPQ